VDHGPGLDYSTCPRYAVHIVGHRANPDICSWRSTDVIALHLLLLHAQIMRKLFSSRLDLVVHTL